MAVSALKIERMARYRQDADDQTAVKAGSLGYMPNLLARTTLPHRDLKEHYYKRINGDYVLMMVGNPDLGLPYGAFPRLFIIWLTTLVNLNKNKTDEKTLTFPLGKTFSSFLKALDLNDNGGVRGDATRLRHQIIRLFSTQISFIKENKRKGFYEATQFLLTRSFSLWWNPIKGENRFNESTITLSQDFYDMLIDKPIPIDLRALKIFRKSPLEMDIYIWLTHRFSYLKKETLILWKSLRDQFGSNYAKDAAGLRHFKFKFKKALRSVNFIYSQALVRLDEDGLFLIPSPTHIPKFKKTEGDFS